MGSEVVEIDMLRLDWIKKSVLATAGAAAMVAQTPSSFGGLATAASKTFEVATVKLNPSGDARWRLGPPGRGSISIDNLQLKKIIASSFRIQDSMVFGPSWLDDARYDIVGKGPDPTASNPEVWEMMRFKMKYHIESREQSIWALVVAKGGPKLKNPENGRCAEAIKAGQTCGDIQFLRFGVGIYNMPIGALIGALGRMLQDRPIVDKTGLTGKYDTAVTWTPDGMKPEQLEGVPKEQRPEDISMFEALEKQAGLKLEAQKAPVRVVVIDSIERPSEN
jgi:uncharacterized protein (TIGR03435 family)